MVKRTPPLAVAVIGTGETSAKNVEALLNDYTAPYAEVTFVLPVDDEHWTPTLGVIHDWLIANEIPYVAVTDGSSPGKAIVPVLEGADSTIKVARVSVKMVQLLKEESGEGADVTLLVAWDDEDAEASSAVNKALSSDVTALNLCDGLDPFEYDDEGDDDPEGEVAQAPRNKGVSEPVDEPTDDYETKGIRALRAILRERDSGFTDRQIGQMEKADAVEALRGLDKGTSAPEEGDEAQQESRTTKARRAFAEGASEGQDEARPLPRSKGSDILETEDEGIDIRRVQDAKEIEVDGKVLKSQGESPMTTVEPNEDGLRHRALELAISGGKSGAEAIADAMKYETYLKGERQSGGRPRADGTPAQAREINEEGKPVRRRRSSSTE